MGDMTKLLNQSLKKFITYAALVLICSIPVYYLAVRMLWQFEMAEHKIVLTDEAGREDSFLIIGAVSVLTFIFFILLLGGFILLNRKISSKLWQPFYSSLGRIRDFDLNSQNSIEFEQTDIAEFSELNQGLDKLLSANITAYQQQREFADNASHELQAPLAVVQSKLELLMQSKSLTHDQYDIIEDALKALSRVSRINQNLLMLTKIENSQFMEKETIKLSELLHNTAVQFRNFTGEKDVALSTQIAPGVTIESNKMLVEILLNNLLTNSIRHNCSQGNVLIRLTANTLTVANSGTAPLQPGQLFRRFSTASSRTPGTGLGLALVKQICSRYQWQISYDFEGGMHVFNVRM